MKPHYANKQFRRPAADPTSPSAGGAADPVTKAGAQASGAFGSGPKPAQPRVVPCSFHGRSRRSLSSTRQVTALRGRGEFSPGVNVPPLPPKANTSWESLEAPPDPDDAACRPSPQVQALPRQIVDLAERGGLPGWMALLVAAMNHAANVIDKLRAFLDFISGHSKKLALEAPQNSLPAMSAPPFKKSLGELQPALTASLAAFVNTSVKTTQELKGASSDSVVAPKNWSSLSRDFQVREKMEEDDNVPIPAIQDLLP